MWGGISYEAALSSGGWQRAGVLDGIGTECGAGYPTKRRCLRVYGSGLGSWMNHLVSAAGQRHIAAPRRRRAAMCQKGAKVSGMAACWKHEVEQVAGNGARVRLLSRDCQGFLGRNSL